MPVPARRPPGTFRIGSIAGSDVLVSSSWFFVAALIAVGVSPRVEQVSPNLGVLKYVAGLAFAVVLYGSVLLHEASHAVMARRFGYPVTSITLHFLGGMTAIDGEAERPRQEFWIAVVGPLTSLAVGIVAVGLWALGPTGLLLFGVEGLAGANLIVGVLNLIPGLPLDGGRVLKSLVWGATGNMHRGTIAAGWGGRATAVAAVAWPFVQGQVLGQPPGALDLVIDVAIAAFLWTGATAAINSARIRQKLPALNARGLVRRALTVPEDLPLAEAVRRAREGQAGSIVTLTSAGAPSGVVSETALLATPEERRPWMPTSAVARSIDPGMRLSASLGGEQLVDALRTTPASEYVLVEDDGSVLGVLSSADVDRAIRQLVA